MKILSFTEARQNFAKTLDAVVEDAEETVIHRAGREPVVIISLKEWNSIKETEHLLSSPANAAALRESLAQLERGEVVHASMEQLEAMEREDAGADVA